MTILVVNISQRTWSILPTVGSAPKRFGHAVARIGNRFYIFGGTDRLPEHVETNISWDESTHQILSSYSVLEYDSETGRGIWTIENKPYPEDVPSMGYLMDAVVNGSTNADLRILLIPGFREDHEQHFDKLGDFVLYNPSNDSILTSRAIEIQCTPTYIPYRLQLSSKAGQIVPPYSDSLLFLGEVKPSVTRRRKDGPDGEIGPPGKERSFAGFVTVGESMYILGTDVDDDHLVETIIRVRVRE
ncbi:hypothetical protein D9758_005145 [Tetrapyrgos nigripes]|uniref:Uncharacterized protein n=1 Tax=Tetrapyrgos nigripes TaxID=182062 RepID=A0A8H5LX28_9AGAR|nr:hypothetical protein D9758_005145 [Tetrapyrgos nigripes]